MQYSRDCITITSNNLFFHFQKHPHLRGENLHGLRSTFSDWETSPPTWGKPVFRHFHPDPLGNIPTCVGKTLVAFSRLSCLSKHPHLRGENSSAISRKIGVAETSPPAWGKHEHAVARRNVSGNIPTCVGKTLSTTRAISRRWKHPHLRGENELTSPTDEIVGETSPPAWGKPKNEH